ncbi:M1 family metallopeptidase [Candidatus Woesearchaeota archaeon]|nr:M1 family metallopeptidase [Candidatus Woesearchaeota archaeon]
MAEKKLFKFYPEDFGTQPIKVKHMNLHFDVFDDYTVVNSEQIVIVQTDVLSKVSLNAKNLEIHDVFCNESEVKYTYDFEKDLLHIMFETPQALGTELHIHTKSTCRPTKNDLEGLYYDQTPEGAPPQQITQCQQWGFQKIVPCIDDMTNKCTYRTKISADSRYTNIITNGDPLGGRVPAVGEDGKVVEGRVTVEFANETTPMATYLFFLGVGTWDTHERVFTYPNGNKFKLELLALPGSDKVACGHSLDMLTDGIMWIHLFTGENKYENEKLGNEIFQLFKEREQAEKDGNEELVEELNLKMKKLSQDKTWGYEYTGTVYREIAMQNSNFGGMENVGNTTIAGNRLLPSKDVSDRLIHYIIGVKEHEFYHNLNGSEVTGYTPFEFWLNEAMTVYEQEHYEEFHFGREANRFGSALGIISPDSGTLSLDRGATSMPIVPDGFNTPDELVTGITYVKSPEFLRMMARIVGKEKFTKAFAKYHSKFKHSNARTDDWINTMSKETGFDLAPMAKQWLKQTGYPTLKITSEYDNGKLKLNLSQSNDEGKQWMFPFAFAGFDKDGKKLFEEELFIKEINNQFEIETDEPFFLSLNREFSFYGMVEYTQPRESLIAQYKYDDDLFARFLAWYALLDTEKTELLKGREEVDSQILDLYWEKFSDEKLMLEVGSGLLVNFEYVSDKTFSHDYEKLYQVRTKISKAVATKNKEGLLKIYKKYHGKTSEKKDYVQKIIEDGDIRGYKNTALALLSRLDTPDIHEILKEQYYTATNGSDRMSAFSMILDSSMSDKEEVLKHYESQAINDLVKWESYLAMLGRAESDDVVDMLKRIEKHEYFRIDQANDQRATYMLFTYNKRKSFQTQEGREFVRDSLLKLSTLNEFTTVGILEAFGEIDKMDKQYHTPLVQILVDVLRNVTEAKQPSVYKTIIRMLLSLKEAVNTYTQEKGEISELQTLNEN